MRNCLWKESTKGMIGDMSHIGIAFSELYPSSEAFDHLGLALAV
jgi:hypothetical protein